MAGIKEEIIGNCRLILGDCLDVLRTIPDNSVDSIVTDPPYGLSFMGKKWDYDVPSVEVWAECLRVLKPGGYLLAFAGTRTQHRMAVRIEDAGFEIRDMIAWVYGSGFPKSHDVSKAIDKKANEMPVFDSIRAHLREWRDRNGYDNKALNEAAGSATSGGGMARHWTSEEGGQHAIPSKDQWRKLKALLGWPDCEFDVIYDAVKDGAERPIIGQQRGTMLAVAPGEGNDRSATTLDITAPATPAARQWQGWGTALKPSLEPVTVARKPLIGTVADNVLRHGTGALNIDGCRVTTDDGKNRARPPRTPNEILGGGKGTNLTASEHNDAGRWPANLIHDGSDEVVGLFPANAGASAPVKGSELSAPAKNVYGGGMVEYRAAFHADKGSAARFFYCAKASKRDRDEGLEGFEAKPANSAYGDGLNTASKVRTEEQAESGVSRDLRRNTHPTVKPTDLMRYLCRLVTPPGGVVLDPFMGSGSTGKAAMREGFRFIGCELSPEYMTIARARIEEACKQPRLIMDEQPIQEQGEMFGGNA